MTLIGLLFDASMWSCNKHKNHINNIIEKTDNLLQCKIHYSLHVKQLKFGCIEISEALFKNQ